MAEPMYSGKLGLDKQGRFRFYIREERIYNGKTYELNFLPIDTVILGEKASSLETLLKEHPEIKLPHELPTRIVEKMIKEYLIYLEKIFKKQTSRLTPDQAVKAIGIPAPKDEKDEDLELNPNDKKTLDLTKEDNQNKRT